MKGQLAPSLSLLGAATSNPCTRASLASSAGHPYTKHQGVYTWCTDTILRCINWQEEANIKTTRLSRGGIGQAFNCPIISWLTHERQCCSSPAQSERKSWCLVVAGSRVTKIHSSRAASTVANRTAKCEQAETLQDGDKTRLVQRSACTMQVVPIGYICWKVSSSLAI